MKKIKILILTLLMTAVPGSVALAKKKSSPQQYVTIGTGGVTGVYYVTGGAICRLVNKERKKHKIRCSVESTEGSIYNLNTIRAGELDMGIAQSDWQFHAYRGSSKFKKQGSNKSLRAVFSVHSEPFTVIARKGSGIKVFSDLKGKRVNIGNPGSGQRGTMEVVMKTLGWKKSDFALASELKSAEQSQALCDNKIDAMVLTVGHPAGTIKEVTTACDSVLIPVVGPKIDQLVAKHPYYRTATIPGGMYRGNSKATNTFGVSATFVSSAQTPKSVIYEVVKAVFENFKDFKRLHPAFHHLSKKEMITEGLSAPLHDGAIKYYTEAGLMGKKKSKK